MSVSEVNILNNNQCNIKQTQRAIDDLKSQLSNCQDKAKIKWCVHHTTFTLVSLLFEIILLIFTPNLHLLFLFKKIYTEEITYDT